jgi:hypothetical protein
VGGIGGAGGGGGAAIAGGPDSEEIEVLLKYGFLDCSTAGTPLVTGAAFVTGGLLRGVGACTLFDEDSVAAGGGAGGSAAGGDGTRVVGRS